MAVDVEPRLLLQMLAGMAERLASAPGLRTVCEAVLPAVAESLGAEVASLVLRDGEHTLRVVATVGLSQEARTSWLDFDVAAPIPLAAAVRESRSIWVTDVESARDEFPALPPRLRSRSLCTIPLRAGGSVIGALGFGWDEPHDFDDGARQMVGTAAGLAAAACAGQVLPSRDRLVPHEHDAAEGVSIACLTSSGTVDCAVHAHRSGDRPGPSAVFATLLAAEPELGTRTRDAVIGVLALARRRRTPAALVRLVAAELAEDLDGSVTGAHVEISPGDGWVAITALDDATIVLATPGGAPPATERFVGERVVPATDDHPATVLVVALEIGTDPDTAATVRDLAERALVAPADSAESLLSRLSAGLESSEMAPAVRGALAVRLDVSVAATNRFSAPDLELLAVGQVIGGPADGERHLVDGDHTPLCGKSTAGGRFEATSDTWDARAEDAPCRACGLLAC